MENKKLILCVECFSRGAFYCLVYYYSLIILK